MRLRILYRSGSDDVSERDISSLVVEPPNVIHAFCHARGEERTFKLDRIEHALDLETGEVIADIWLHLGLPSLAPPPLKLPDFSGPRPVMSSSELQNLRRADKANLFRRFKYEVIIRAKRRQLWALFNDRCFCCNSPGPLDLDHHVPQALGGRLVPGNVVLLCSACNLMKRDANPESFYSQTQLSDLRPILEAQLTLFDFRFSWTRWTNHPQEYLVSLGATEADARAAISDPGHELYVGDPRR